MTAPHATLRPDTPAGGGGRPAISPVLVDARGGQAVATCRRIGCGCGGELYAGQSIRKAERAAHAHLKAIRGQERSRA